MNLIIGALEQGLLYSILGMGIFLTFRILRIPDLTADGSLVLGGAVAAVITLQGRPLLAIPAAFAAGALAGAVTGLIHVKIGVAPILSGVLTMSGLYTINLAIQSGAPNLSLLGTETLYSLLTEEKDFLIPFLCCILVLGGMVIFFHTGTGLAIRAAGSNPAMSRALSVNPGRMKLLGLAAANALAGLTGGLLVQYRGYADVNTGSGTMVAGLAGIILGEVILGEGSPTKGLLACITGSVLYQLIMALAIRYNLFPAYAFKLVSAGLIILVLGVGYTAKEKKCTKTIKT